MEMMEELKKPLFSTAELQRTKLELGFVIRPIAYKDYYEHMDEYRRRSIKRLDLFNEFGKKYLPREVFTISSTACCIGSLGRVSGKESRPLRRLRRLRASTGT